MSWSWKSYAGPGVSYLRPLRFKMQSSIEKLKLKEIKLAVLQQPKFVYVLEHLPRVHRQFAEAGNEIISCYLPVTNG